MLAVALKASGSWSAKTTMQITSSNKMLRPHRRALFGVPALTSGYFFLHFDVCLHSYFPLPLWKFRMQARERQRYQTRELIAWQSWRYLAFFLRLFVDAAVTCSAFLAWAKSIKNLPTDRRILLYTPRVKTREALSHIPSLANALTPQF